MFYIILILFIFILLFDIYYLIKKIQNLDCIKKIKNNIIKWSISFIPFLLIFIFFNYVDVIVILFHLTIFFKMSELIVYFLNKLTKKELSFNLICTIAIIITTIYLGYGYYSDYHIEKTFYEIYTEKIADDFRIIQISDAHIGTTFDGKGFYHYIETIKDIESDIVVITGDFVDDDTKKEDMIKGTEALNLLKPKYGTYFIYGNHDKGYFNNRDFNANDLEKELKKNNVIILKDEIKDIGNNILLIGRLDKSFPNRKSIEELTNNLDKTKYIISLNHQPNDYEKEKNQVDLVLSGHTHGGQLFPLGYLGLLMKANDEVYGMHQKEHTIFIVNSGISDWKTKFKTGTFSEIGIIDIKKK